ncbi:MAG TPA: hypothetical protein PKC45_03645 [Gemmatales bacterium]|nr:hypothetical protein [Gemmatales bacterium]
MANPPERLAIVNAEIARLELLQAEFERQKQEVAQLEEMVKSLRWESYQTELAYRQVEEEGTGFLGFLSGLFGGTEAKRADMRQVAVEAREAYEAARDKMKPLKEELVTLEVQLEKLPAFKSERADLVARQAETLHQSGSPVAAALAAVEHNLELLGHLKEEVAKLIKLGQRAQRLLLTCDDGNLFATRHEVAQFQKPFADLIHRLHEFPAEWALPDLPAEGDVRLLDPVGTGIQFQQPERSPLAAMPLGMESNLIRQAEQSALRAALRAPAEAIKNQAKFQAITFGHWLTKLEALRDRTVALIDEKEQLRVGMVTGDLVPAADAASSGGKPSTPAPASPTD